MKVSVVIPNWNGEHLLKKNLPHVLKIGADEVIVVDDGSTDNSVEFIRNFQFPTCPSGRRVSNFQLIKNDKNQGFAKSVNRGVAHASGEIVVLLNTDVKPQPSLIDAVIPHFKDSNVFAVSFAEVQWSWARGIWRNGFVEHEPGKRASGSHETFWVSGGSGAFRKSLWEKLGGFDPIYSPFYWEDIDLCYRAAKRGYKLLWEPNAQVVHGHEGTIGKYFSRSFINFIQERNQVIFIWKNITSPKMIREHLSGLIQRIFNSPGYLKVLLAAFSKLPHVLAMRAKEKKEQRVSDEEIFAQFR